MSRAAALRIEMHGKQALVPGFPLPRRCPHWDHSDNTVGSERKAGVVIMSSKSSSGSWWSALGFGKSAAAAPDTDYADMGTAFGLDASLDMPRLAACFGPGNVADALLADAPATLA